MEIKTVTILGANGTMGRNVAGIFASFGNAKVYMVCRSSQDAANAKKKASLSVRAEAIDHNLIAATYDELEKCIKESDLIFESVAENKETKNKIYRMISEHIRQGTIIGTGTSGLSVNNLCKSFSENHRKNFLGIHMYNPPYNMTLCEVIPSEDTDKELLRDIKKYLKEVLYRDVVEVKDQPAFMGNRIGFQFINEVMQYAEKYKENGGIDYIDAILGGFTGRSMAPLVTSDFVGLDVHKAIVDNVFENTNDYAHDTFAMPEFANRLINENKLGRKTGEGLYRKVVKKDGKKVIEVFDIETQKYRPVKRYEFNFVHKMKDSFMNGSYKDAMRALLDDNSTEGSLCVQFLIKYVLYSLYVSKSIGEDIHSADHVMATGFSWIPPLALISAFNTVSSFKKIVKEKMSNDFLEKFDFNNLLEGIEESTYDYRPFFKAK